MKKLPEIYKEVVNVNNNKKVFYSKNGAITDAKEVRKDVNTNNSYLDNLKTVFLLGKNSYTKKVRLTTKDRTYETRLIRRNYGKILTIDNDIINEEDITSLEIL